jgi:CRP/FNR family transcriptional regulator, cyclic AMP receptor protein
MTIDDLVQAVQSLNADDAFRPRLQLEQWRVLGPYLVQGELRSGELLVRQGDSDRAMYLLGQGTLQVYAVGAQPGANRIAILRPGSVVGEPGLFSDGPRGANVEAMTPCSIWALRSARLDELALRVPTLAYEILRAAGAVMSVRLRANLARQVPFS